MGYVYLINMVGTNNYKIGYTTRDVITRLNELQTGNPEALKLVSFYKTKNHTKLESWLHRKNKFKRKEGEWFEFDDEFVKGFITECQTLDEIITLLLEENPFFN